ncbi:MAG: hypothetical protein ABIP75_14475 [Pyrinomonadaceae bacterium]
MAVIWKKGQRLFTVAAWLMLLMAIFHTIVQFGPSSGAEETSVVNAMRGFHIDLGLGMKPSWYDIFADQSFTFSILVAALAVINLVVASAPESSPALMKKVTWLNVIWVIGFIGLAFAYRVPPPLISGIVILVFLIASLIVNRRRA